MKRLMMALVVLACLLPATAHAQDRLWEVFGSDGTWHPPVTWNTVSNMPQVECVAPAGGSEVDLVKIDGTAVEHTGGYQGVYAYVQTMPVTNVNMFDANGVGVYQDLGSLRTVAYDIAGAVKTVWDVTSATLATAALQTAANAILTSTEISASSTAGSTASMDGKMPALVGGAVPVTGTFFQVTQPVSGTFYPVTQPVSGTVTVNGTLTTVSTVTSLTQMNGQAISMGTGVRDAGTQRVTVATDDIVPVTVSVGSVVDSASGAQQASWLLVADGTSNDANHGTMTVVAANTPVKLYTLPAGKGYHDISIAMTDDSTDDFDFTVQIFGVNDLPTAGFDIDAWLSVGSLLVPSWRMSLDQSELLISQPVIRSHATYLLVVFDAVTTNPTDDPELRIFSYNEGDSR